jgi:hypothetical protein
MRPDKNKMPRAERRRMEEECCACEKADVECPACPIAVKLNEYYGRLGEAWILTG